MNGEFALARRIVANDLRLFFRGSQQARLRWITSGLGRVLVLALLHLPAFGLVWQYKQVGGAGGPELACLFLLLLLVTSALNRCLEVLYNRGDLPLLLASPVPSRIVLLTRLLDVLLTTLLGTGVVLLPLVDAAVFVVDVRWAHGLLAHAAATLLVVPLALLLTLAVVGRFGARRARTLVQMLGILLGMAAFAVMQAPNWLAAGGGHEERIAATADFLRWFTVPPLTQLAAAAAGSWPWLLGLGSLGLLLWVVAFRMLARQFTAGAQSAAGDVGAAAAGRRASGDGWAGAFSRPRWRVLWRKEVLLLRRDPLLLLRCSLQIMSLVPALVGMLWLQRAAGLAGLGLVATGLVAVQLSALMTANDEAHEFVAASPLAPRERAWARTAAAALPTTLFGQAMAVVVLWFGGVAAAALVALGAAANALAMAWLGACTVRPPTAEERSRNRPPKIVWQTFTAMLLGTLGAAGAGVVDAGYFALGLALFAASIAGAALAFLARPQPVRLAS